MPSIYNIYTRKKNKQKKTRDKIRRFGVVITPLSMKMFNRKCKLHTAWKWFWREELTKGANSNIIKMLSHEWSPISRWDLALRFLWKAFRTISIQTCVCIFLTLQNALFGPEGLFRASSYINVRQWRRIVVHVF